MENECDLCQPASSVGDAGHSASVITHDKSTENVERANFELFILGIIFFAHIYLRRTGTSYSI